MANKSQLDPDSAGAVAAVEAEQMSEHIAGLAGKNREQLIAQIFQVIGQIKAVNMMSEFGTVASLLWLKQVKESKIYKDIPGFGSWESFCNHIGKERRYIDERLQNLNVLGPEFLATVASFKVGFRELRKLRFAAQDGDMIIDTEGVTIGEEKIPLTPDHVEDLEAAIEHLLDSKQKKIDDQASLIKAKERIIDSKDKVIFKQETDLARYERTIKAKGLAPGEEKFIKQLGDIQLSVTGELARLNPEGIDLEEATPRMKATYMETLGYIHRWAREIDLLAKEIYGAPGVDTEDWTPLGVEKPKPTACDLCRAAHSDCDKCCNTCVIPCAMKQVCVM